MEELKKKLFQLHFLLTEKESDETIRQSFEQFKTCFSDAMSQLSAYLKNEFNVKTDDHLQIVERANEKKLINSEMEQKLRRMVLDYKKMETEADQDLYNCIKKDYAGYLQTIYDMLSRMGQDIDDEE